MPPPVSPLFLSEREREREERRAKSLCFPAGLCVKQQGRSAADEQGKRLSERKKKKGKVGASSRSICSYQERESFSKLVT